MTISHGGAPINLGPGVNSAFFDAGAGFFENEEGGRPILIPELSSPANERRPSVRFDGQEIFFDSDRAGSLGADLWASTRDTVMQPWSIPSNLGTVVNSASDDIQPYIAADRATLFFASNRP